MTDFETLGRKTRKMAQHYSDCVPDDRGYCACPQEEVPVEDCDVICSDVGLGDLHMPVIDLDFPCRLVPSATPGHFHLYIDKAITWDRFEMVLNAMAVADLVEEGFCNASIARGYASVRHPNKPKVLTP